MSDSIDVVCPCCSTKLVVDPSGEILSEERPRMDADKTFEDAMGVVREGAQKREDAFSKAFERTRNLDDLLNKKFEEAKKKASKEDGKPRSPFDMD